MFCCSASGEKLKPMLIGKAKKPRCFKNINVTNLPVIWRSNKKKFDDRNIIHRLDTKCK